MMINIPINASNYDDKDRNEQYKQQKQIINGQGVHNPIQLVLVGLLIICSVCVIYTTNSEIYQHDRYIRTYFNLNILGKYDLGLYEQGLNIDECQMQFVTLQEIKDHFIKMINITQNLQDDGMVLFKSNVNEIIKYEIKKYDNQINITQFYTVQQAFQYFNNFQYHFIKNWLLNAQDIKIIINLGQDKFVQNYTLTAYYQVYSQLMLRVKLDTEYKLKNQKSIKLNGLRILQQIIAFILFTVYLYQVILLVKYTRYHSIMNKNININKSIINKYKFWYYFLMLMSLIIIFSQTFAPICAFLQILPIFQFPQKQKDNQMYNFNKNLRFSFPLIMSIFLQIFICLNGFILYSMLIYPGQYFDDYLKGFFSYIYQMFQVGTYQIFTQLQSYGNFAYLLYAILYFWAFQVGNTLVTALFVILIEMKITERFLKSYVVQLAHEAVCPMCHQKNSHPLQGKNMNIVVNSPKISPLINTKKFKQSLKQQQTQSLMVFIEEQHSSHMNLQFYKNPKFSNLSNKILNQTRKLQTSLALCKDYSFYSDFLEKILRIKQKIVD